MQVTFLIGNGFDLNQGLKTSYKNFFDKYSKIKKRDSEAVKNFKSKLLLRKDLWSDCERLLGEITEYFSLENKQDLLDGIEDLRHAMAQYLKSQSKRFKFKISRHRKELKKTLNNLFCQEGYLYPPIEILPNSNENKYQFVVFNYNTIVYDIVNKIKAKERSHNRVKITGNINTDKRLIHYDTNYGFVLGVNDCSQIKNTDFRQDKNICDALIKNNQRAIMYANEDVRDYVCNSDVVYVYGMSIGDTDKRCWEQLVKWLTGSSDKKLIISYYDKKITGIDLVKIQQAKTRLIDKLSEYGLKEEFYKQVEIVINPTIFNFAKRNRKSR